MILDFSKVDLYRWSLLIELQLWWLSGVDAVSYFSEQIVAVTPMRPTSVENYYTI